MGTIAFFDFFIVFSLTLVMIFQWLLVLIQLFSFVKLVQFFSLFKAIELLIVPVTLIQNFHHNYQNNLLLFLALYFSTTPITTTIKFL